VIIWFAARTVPEQSLENAALDGATPWARFWHIALPQFGPAVFCAWLVGVAVATGDLSTSILVLPPGVTTISSRIFNLAHYGVEDQLAGLCLVAVVLFTALAGMSLALGRWWWGRSEE
jgi:iron(III) transport system permease protein